jgi:hypothetical protein
MDRKNTQIQGRCAFDIWYGNRYLGYEPPQAEIASNRAYKLFLELKKKYPDCRVVPLEYVRDGFAHRFAPISVRRLRILAKT